MAVSFPLSISWRGTSRTSGIAKARRRYCLIQIDSFKITWHINAIFQLICSGIILAPGQEPVVFTFINITSKFIDESQAGQTFRNDFGRCISFHFLWEVTSKDNFDFVLRWVSVADFVGCPPTKKEVQAQFIDRFFHLVGIWKNIYVNQCRSQLL